VAAAAAKKMSVDAYIDSGAMTRQGVNPENFQIDSAGPTRSYEEVVTRNTKANRKFDDTLGGAAEGVKGIGPLMVLKGISNAAMNPALKGDAEALANIIQGTNTEASWKSPKIAELAKKLGLKVTPGDLNPTEREALKAALSKLRIQPDGSPKEFSKDDVKVIDEQVSSSQELYRASTKKAATNIATQFDRMNGDDIKQKDEKLSALMGAAKTAWANFGATNSDSDRSSATEAVKALDTYIAGKKGTGSAEDKKFYGGVFAAVGSVTGGSGERRERVQKLVKQYNNKDISAETIATDTGLGLAEIKKEFGNQAIYKMDAKMQDRLTNFAAKTVVGAALSADTAVENQKKRDSEQINALRAITEAILATHDIKGTDAKVKENTEKTIRGLQGKSEVR
jgi:hypothetical protein